MRLWRRFGAGVLLILTSGLSLAQSPELVAKSQRAKELMAAGKFEEAIPIYQELVGAVPGNPGLLMNLGIAQHMAGHDREAIAPLETALKLEPNLPPAWFILGASYLSVGQTAKATSFLEKAVTALPKHPGARQLLGQALLSQERFELAVEQFEVLTKLEPDNPKGWYGLGQGYESLVRSAFDQLAKTAPESGHLLALVAQARAKEKQYMSAFHFYRQALARQPRLPGLHAAVAEIYRATGHPDWAAVEEQKEKQLPPIDCKSNKLACDFRGGRYRDVVAASARSSTPESLYWRSQACNELATQAYQRLGQLPPSVEHHELMAMIHRVQGRLPEAIQQWREALKLAPNDPRLETELAVTLHMFRDHERARPLLEKLVRQRPDSAELNFLLGDVLLSLQETDKAIPLLKKATGQNPELLQAHASLARAYVQSNRGEMAIPHLKAALPTDDDGSLHFQLARAYQEAGQPALAKELLVKYQELRKAQQAETKELEEEFQIVAP